MNWMNYVSDARFVVVSFLMIFSFIALFSVKNYKGKHYLSFFLVLYWVTYLCFYLPTFLQRNNLISKETTRTIFSSPSIIVLHLLFILSFVFLLLYIVSLKSSLIPSIREPEEANKDTVAIDLDGNILPAANPPVAQHSIFLRIPAWRLIALSIVSFGIYEGYWIYRNWRYVKERDNLNFQPFWRGLFGVFYCHSLLQRIHEDVEARATRTPSFSPKALATGWVICIIVSNLISRLPAVEAIFISPFIPAFLFLLPVQAYINAVEDKRLPSQGFYPWSTGHLVCIVSGLAIWGILLSLTFN